MTNRVVVHCEYVRHEVQRLYGRSQGVVWINLPEPNLTVLKRNHRTNLIL